MLNASLYCTHTHDSIVAPTVKPTVTPSFAVDSSTGTNKIQPTGAAKPNSVNGAAVSIHDSTLWHVLLLIGIACKMLLQ